MRTKKEVSSSNLALRFEKSQGWTRQILESYLTKGKILDTEILMGDRRDDAYFILDVGSALDLDRLYEDHVGKVYRAFDDYPEMTDLEFMKSKNW